MREGGEREREVGDDRGGGERERLEMRGGGEGERGWR